MAVTKSDLFPNDTMGMENKTVVVTTILVRPLVHMRYISRANEKGLHLYVLYVDTFLCPMHACLL